MLETNRDFYNGYQAGLRANGVQPTPDAGDIVYDPDGEYDNGTVGKAIQSMDAGDVAYDASESYNSGTVGAALSDVKIEISDLAPSIYGNYVQKSIAKTAIASFDDGADGVPLKALAVEIEPVQDLHGFDNPWPAGGGKNRLQPSASKSVSSNGITFTSDGNGAYTVSGTSTAIATYDFPIPEVTFATTDYMYLFNNATTGSATVNLIYNDGTSATQYFSIGFSTTNRVLQMTNATGTKANYLRIYVGSGATLNVKIQPMISTVGTETAYSPFSNICPISGFDTVGVTRTGINIWDEEVQNGYYSSATGAFNPYSGCVANKNRIPVIPEKTYYIHSGTYGILFFTYGKDGNFLGQIIGQQQNVTLTIPANVYYINFCNGYGAGGAYNNDISINSDSTDTSYHAYNALSVSIPLGSTVYGGTLDVVHGVLTVDRAMVDLGTLTWETASGIDYFFAQLNPAPKVVGAAVVYNALSSMYPIKSWNDFTDKTACIYYSRKNGINIKDSAYSVPTDLKTAVTGQTLVYELATPTTITLDPANLTTALGANNIFADSGDIELTYRVEPTAFPDAPSEDGTYILKVTISDGVATYSWEAES